MKTAPKPGNTLSLNTFVQIFHDKHHFATDERFCFILGSGAARTAGVPTGAELVDRWLVEMHDMQQPDAKRLRPLRAPIETISNALLDPEKDRLAAWAKEAFGDLKGFNFEQRAQFYGHIFTRRFESLSSLGEDFLRTLMEKSQPSLGYHFLARILTQTRHHLVITTNFDHLVEKAVAVCSGLPADTFGSEELAAYLQREQHSPAVAKIHGDIRLKSYNALSDIETLRQKWEEPLRVLLRRYTPVFIGYGGNDPGFMRFLCAELPALLGERPCYWVARKLDDFDEQPWRAKFAKLSCARLVVCPGFSELMLKLNAVFGFEPLPAQLRKRADEIAAEIEAAEREEREKLTKLEAMSFSLSGEATSDGARVEAIPPEKRDWHDWRELARAKVGLDERLGVLRDGIARLDQHPTLRALYVDYENRARPALASAEADVRQAVSDSEELFGPEGEETLAAMNSLANILLYRGDFAGAEPLYRRCLEARERTLGPEHPDTLISVNNLAVLFLRKRDYAGAEPFFRRCLEAWERITGKDHPDTVDSVFGLANVLHLKGDYAEAEALYRRCLEARERTLGPEHSDTAKTAFNFSLLEERQGKLREALPLAEEAFAAAKASLPEDHPSRLKYEKYLADLRARFAASPAPSSSP